MGYIYMLTSPNGKSYIGQTYRPIEKRLEDHRTGKSSDCVAIYNAIQYHGWENFEKDWYEVPDEDLNKHEELMVEVLGTLSPDGYNLKGGGGNGKHSAETRQKMSESHIGKILTDEHKQNMRKKKSDEHKQNIRESRLGKKHTEKSIQKMREVKRGILKSDETKQRMSETRKGEKNHMSKRVYQYALDGAFIGSFGSTEEAARYLTKTGQNIRACVLVVNVRPHMVLSGRIINQTNNRRAIPFSKTKKSRVTAKTLIFLGTICGTMSNDNLDFV
jgi:group I intron endonuclease